MANSEHLEILRQGLEVWSVWRANNFEVNADLSGADLSGMNLTGANFDHADLSNTYMEKSRLSEAFFSSANLSSANLKGADIRDTYLDNADLSDANLCKADLTGSILEDTTLDGADLQDAKLTKANLSRANACWADLSRAQLISTNFSGANLRYINLSYAYLIATEFDDADLKEADLQGIKSESVSFRNANLRAANFSNAILSRAGFGGANLSEADFTNSDLSESKLLNADFTGAILTGACIADWQIGNSTQLDNIICDYIYRAIDEDGQFSGRLPVNPESTFAPGEFVLWASVRASALETIDLTFTEGFNWQDFFSSLQEVRQQNPEAGIFLQGVEERNGQYVVRLRIETDKIGGDRTILEARIETTTKELIETKRRLYEAHGEVKALERTLEKTLRMATDQGPKYNLQGAQFGGSFAETVQGNQIGGIINNYGSNTDDIVRLLTSLREQVQALPTEHKEEAFDLLDDIEIDLNKPEPDTNRIGRKLKRFAEIASILAAGTVIFSGNLNEIAINVIKLTETLGIPIEQVQPRQISPEDTTY